MQSKIIIYQVLPRLFSNTCETCIPHGTIAQNGVGKLNDFTPKVLSEIKSLGITHIWYTGIIEHATQTDYSRYGIRPNNKYIVKGKAGSPYAISDYYDIDPDLATDVPNRMAEFEALVARTHDAGMKVIIDFVPNHVAREYHSDNMPEGVENLGVHDNTEKQFDPDNNFYYIPRLRDIMLFWCGKGIDAFRCDMVHMVPVEFWHWAIGIVKEQYPHIQFIAEIYDPALYDRYLNYGGFDFLYDKVGLYDKLRAVQCHEVSAAQISYCWQALDGHIDHMLNFLENHDEQRFASIQYAGDASKVLPALVVSSMMGKSPFMIYFGQELGEPAEDAEGYSGKDGRTTIFDYWSVPTVRAWYNHGKCNIMRLSPERRSLRKLYKKVLTLCNKEIAISNGAFYDLMYVNFGHNNFDPHRHYAFLRYYGNEILVIIVNFGPYKTEVATYIPQHAIDMMQIVPGRYMATELLEKTHDEKDLQADTPFITEVEGYGAVIWKIKASQKTSLPTTKI